MEAKEIQVREAKADDLEAMAEIWWQLMSEHAERDPEYWGLIARGEAVKMFRKWREQNLGDAKHISLAAVAKGRVVGFVHGIIRERISIYPLNRVGYLNDIAVRRDSRGQGVGRALLDALEAAFRERGVRCLELMVDEDNPAAQKLYESSGFYVRQRQMVKKLEEG
jgi:ribosomal protein S18 acetylase RimI-like enzyme